MKIKSVRIETLVAHPSNPRTIKTERYKKLKESIQKFPEMLNLRPLVINEKNEVLGGNMRLFVLKELGYKEVPVLDASGLSLEQQNEFLIKDNLNYGEWDYDILANIWDTTELGDWGMDLPVVESTYVPVYEPTIDTNDITKDEIEKKAKELAEQMVKSQKSHEVMCPNCGHEFKIS